ncbi:hypothetical protein M2M59_15970 [Rummeliibacillus sp. G93]|uniref:hypothetical protein n=1 Tax=Rummeliibacillus TaxID=648802 RepID=UPI00201C9F74|nr:hypothetical protein [Rummeliibacillus sp. G93]UQW97381.1 hypothetical protein M2M59_15970 [Rummeliibacillus sp. G93]
MNNDLHFIRYFLPPTAAILELETGPVILHADVDGDSIEELISAYSYRGNTFLLMLKQINFQWQPLVHLKIEQHHIAGLYAVKKKESTKKDLVIEWKINNLPPYLDTLTWTSNGFQRQTTPSQQLIITKAYGDVTGDGLIDTVYLTGEKQPDSPLWQNLELQIMNHSQGIPVNISLNDMKGYSPTIFLGDFTGDKAQDILVTVDSGGSGGIIFTKIFSYQNGVFKEIFDDERFNNKSSYKVTYEDGFKVRVTSSAPPKQYKIDLTYKGKSYLSEIYKPNGQLKEPIEGWVDPISGLYPIDFDRDGVYSLLAFQSIAGRYHADRLGYVQSTLEWDGEQFVVVRQNVSIEGREGKRQ